MYREIVEEMERLLSTTMSYCLDQPLGVDAVTNRGVSHMSIADCVQRMESSVDLHHAKLLEKERFVSNIEYSKPIRPTNLVDGPFIPVYR